MSNVSLIDGHIDEPIITIDEAIEHCYEVADKKCDDCGKEHLQLAKWLEELKESREIINRQKAEIERLRMQGEEAISCFNRMESLYKIKCKELEVAKAEDMYGTSKN